MGANDDLEGKKTHLAGFYIHTISGQNILKPSIVVIELWPLSINTGQFCSLRNWFTTLCCSEWPQLHGLLAARPFSGLFPLSSAPLRCCSSKTISALGICNAPGRNGITAKTRSNFLLKEHSYFCAVLFLQNLESN